MDTTADDDAKAKHLLDTAKSHDTIATWRQVQEGDSTLFRVMDTEGRYGAPMTAAEVIRLLG